MRHLEKRNALITGGTTGIGYAAAQTFLSEGARLAITGQNAERLAHAAETREGDVTALRTDQTDLTEIDRMVDGGWNSF